MGYFKYLCLWRQALYGKRSCSFFRDFNTWPLLLMLVAARLLVLLSYNLTESFFTKNLAFSKRKNVFLFKKSFVWSQVSFVSKMAYSLVKNASYTTLGSYTIEKFFIASILCWTLSWNFLPDLELSLDNNIAEIISATLLYRNCILVNDNLRHFEQDIFASILWPSLEKMQILQEQNFILYYPLLKLF